MTKHMTQLLPVQSLANGESAANLSNGLKNQGIQVFYLDGREIYDKQSFLQKVAESMKFPDYFGYNWDALDECITDLNWCPAERYILIYDQPEIFSKAEPTEWKIAYDVLQSAVSYWQATDMPLDILFIGETSENL